MNIQNENEITDQHYHHYKSADKSKYISIPYKFRATTVIIKPIEKLMYIHSSYILDICEAENNYDDDFDDENGDYFHATIYENENGNLHQNMFNSHSFFQQALSPGFGQHFIDKYLSKYLLNIKFPGGFGIFGPISISNFISFHDPQGMERMEITYNVIIDYNGHLNFSLSESMCDLIRDFRTKIYLTSSNFDLIMTNELSNFDLLWRLSKNMNFNLGKIIIPSQDLNDCLTVDEILNINLSADLPVNDHLENEEGYEPEPLGLYLKNRLEKEQQLNN